MIVAALLASWTSLIVPVALAQQPANDAATGAAQLYAKGDDAAALAACGPADTELRARCLLALGRRKEAAAALRALPSRRMAGDLLLAQSLAPGPEADAILERWGTADPMGLELRLARARVHLLSERPPQALADARFVLSREAQRFEGLLLLARATDALGRPDEARKQLAPLLEAKDAEIHLRREAIAATAAAAMRLQLHGDAIALLQPLVEQCPAVVAWRAQLATALGMSGRVADSIEQWEQAIALAPDDGELRWRLADIYRSRMRIDDAITHYQAMAALGYQAAAAELRLGELLLDRGGDGDFERARAHVARAAELAPESGDVMEALARVQEQSGDLAAAKESHRIAFERNPLRFDALYRRIVLLGRSADEAEKAEAKQLLERYRRVEPYLEDLKLAQQEVGVNPTSAPAHTRLAGLLNLAGEYATARTWAERADRLDSRSVQNAVQLGYILANQGDRAGARKAFEQALARIGASAAAPEVVATLRGYVQTIDRGEPLPTPMGEMAERGH